MFWEEVDEVAGLGGEEVQVWRVSAMQSAEVMEGCRAKLSAEDVRRAGRTRAGFARDEFMVGRTLLRVLVGKAVGLAPGDVAFGVGEHGKPRVDGVEFNVSHSRGLVLIALCRRAAVGVDVEGTDAAIEALEIARGSFAEDEVKRIGEATGTTRMREFYRIWTRKEAVTKAKGGGLTMDLGSFSVAEGAGSVRLGGEGCEVKDLPMEEGFAGALAVMGEDRPVRLLRMSGSVVRSAMR